MTKLEKINQRIETNIQKLNGNLSIEQAKEINHQLALDLIQKQKLEKLQ